MVVWQYRTTSGDWVDVASDIAAFALVNNARVRLITDPATLRDCWHCGRVMEVGGSGGREGARVVWV